MHIKLLRTQNNRNNTAKNLVEIGNRINGSQLNSQREQMFFFLM